MVHGAALPFRHSFVKQRLLQLGNKIYIKDEPILTPRSKMEVTIYDSIKKVNTHIKSNSELMEEGEIKEIKDYNDLNRMGWMIVSEKTSTSYFRGQSVEYRLKRYNAHIPSMRSFPPGHYLEFDELNERIRLRGRNAGPMGYGPWIFLSPKSVKKEHKYWDIIDDTQKIKRRLLSRYMQIEETPDITPIPEIPVMISAQGEVVCIENAKDEPVIGIVGGRGSGKTLFAHSIIDHAYWKKPKLRLGILNDSLFQTMPWTLPCDRVEHSYQKQETIFVKGIRKIGESPLPLPLVFLHPSTDTLRHTVFEDEEIGFRMSLPFDHVIKNYNYFMKHKKEWELGKSAPYFRNIKDDLVKCKNLDEIEEVLTLAVEEDKLNKQSKDKIFSVLIDMFNEKILDVNTGIPSKWIIEKNGKKKEMNPVLACMEAGVIPVLMTQNLMPKDYFPQYMRYLIDSIFEHQITESKLKDEPTWVFIDELPDVSSTENRTVASYSLRRCVTEGRNPKLGTIFALQNWTKVDPQIRNNTTHLFSYHNKSREAKAIAKDFDLPTHIEKDIINLQKFRMIGMTHEKFIVYTTEGERYETSEPIKGMAIMPLSQHQAPGGSTGRVEESKYEDDEEDEIEGDEYDE